MAAFTLSEILNLVKRNAKYGTVGMTTDQATADLLSALNAREQELWRARDWECLLEEISFTQLAASGGDKTMPATVGDILMLSADGGDPLNRLGFKNYQKWKKATTPGTIADYLIIGQDAAKSIKVRFNPAPAADTAITGWGKTRLTKRVTSDIATNTDLLPWPDHFQSVIYELLLADAYGFAGDHRLGEQIAKAARGMGDLIAAEASKQDAPNTSPPPDAVRFWTRNRGGSRVT